MRVKTRPQVLLALDADEAGDKGAEEWARALREAGAVPLRLRPTDGCKDFAEALERFGVDGLRECLPEPEPMEPTDDWPEPLPLDETPEPPPFPTDSLPEPIRTFVKAVAEHTQTPPDLPALLALGALAAACARTARVEGAPGWAEPLNFYACVALPSGSRKSAVVSACAAPIEEFEAEQCERLRPEIATRAAERETLETRLQTATRRAASANSPDRPALEADRNEAARELAECPEEHLPRLLVDDATPEVLSRVMSEQQGRIGCLSAEGSVVFGMAAGRYSENGSKLEVYLKGHAGDALRVDRVNRKAEHVRAPAVTLCLTVQPSVLTGAMARPDFRGRGLLARFLWSVPRPTLGYRALTTKPVPEPVRAEYDACLHRLLQRGPSDNPPIIRMSPDSSRAFLAYRERCEHDLRPGERFEHLQDRGEQAARASLAYRRAATPGRTRRRRPRVRRDHRGGLSDR